jgi:regulator of sigma E protease
MLLNKPTTATVIRNGAEVQIPLPTELGQMMVDQGVKMPFTPRIPCVVDTVIAGTPAADAGLMKGDSLVSLDGDTLLYFQAIQQYLKSHPDKPVQVGLYRQGKWMTITPQVTAEGTIGFAPKSPDKYFTYVNRDYGFLEAIPAGVSEAWETVKDYASQLKFIFSASGAKQVGGFATFAKLFPEEWNWAMFWERTAFISLILAFMNILPIPALDGGHVMFLLWEMITGRPASQRIMEVAQMIGMVLLLGLMLYGNGMDIFRWITSH